MRSAAKIVLIALAWLAWPARSDARVLIDATKTRVALADHPYRIVTLTPSLGELAAILCGKELGRIVGVSAYSDRPATLAGVPSVASAAKVNLEAVIALKPDLVLGSREDNSAEQLGHLRELGVPVVVTSGRSLSEIEETFRKVGEAMGEKRQGDRLARKLHRGIEDFSKRATERRERGVRRPKVLLELDDNPLIVVGGGNFINEELQTVGASNLYGGTSRPYPKISTEDAVHRDPDTILILGNGSGMGYFRGLVRNWERFPTLSAVRKHKIQALAADPIVRPGIRILEGLSLLERAIYGDAAGK